MLTQEQKTILGKLGYYVSIPETQPLFFLVIDDTLVLRFSEKAPGSRIAFEHAHKLNQASYVLGQCFVYLTMIQRRPTDEVPTSIPCLARMPSETGNTSKLFTAKALLRLQGKTAQNKADIIHRHYT